MKSPKQVFLSIGTLLKKITSHQVRFSFMTVFTSQPLIPMQVQVNQCQFKSGKAIFNMDDVSETLLCFGDFNG